MKILLNLIFSFIAIFSDGHIRVLCSSSSSLGIGASAVSRHLRFVLSRDFS